MGATTNLSPLAAAPPHPSRPWSKNQGRAQAGRWRVHNHRAPTRPPIRRREKISPEETSQESDAPGSPHWLRLLFTTTASSSDNKYPSTITSSSPRLRWRLAYWLRLWRCREISPWIWPPLRPSPVVCRSIRLLCCYTSLTHMGSRRSKIFLFPLRSKISVSFS